MSGTSSVPRARDEKNHFPSRYDEAYQLEKFLSIGGHRKVINNHNRLYGQSSTPKCFHKQGIITAQTSYLRRKIKRTNGIVYMIIRSNKPMKRKNVMIHKYHVFIFPMGK